MNQHDIGLFIASKRKEQNLTQEQLAEKLGVSNKTVSKWETGKNMPDYSVVEQLCQVLNISVGELIAGKEKEQSEDNSSYEEKIALLSYKIKQLENCKTSQTEASKTINNWLDYIVNSFIDKRYSNGYTEGLNNKIKVIKRNGYGYRNFRFFRLRLLYILNGTISGRGKKKC